MLVISSHASFKYNHGLINYLVSISDTRLRINPFMKKKKKEVLVPIRMYGTKAQVFLET